MRDAVHEASINTQIPDEKCNSCLLRRVTVPFNALMVKHFTSSLPDVTAMPRYVVFAQEIRILTVLTTRAHFAECLIFTRRVEDVSAPR